MATVEDLLDWAEQEIARSKNVDLWRQMDARVNAEDLLSGVLDKQVTSDDLDDEVPSNQAGRFRRYVKRRVAGEPVALILGKTQFMGMDLKVRKGVFVPRNSSELLASKAISRLRSSNRKIGVDVASGTGPVALAMAKRVPGSEVYGLDIWSPSLAVGRSNAKLLGLSNVTFLKSDMLQRLPRKLRGSVDVFTMHPPYVARRYVRTLPAEIKEFEPHTSLSDQSADGLRLVRLLADEAPEWLRPGGWVMVEVSPDLSRKVKMILSRAGFEKVKSEKDSLGATRVISGSKPRTTPR